MTSASADPAARNNGIATALTSPRTQISQPVTLIQHGAQGAGPNHQKQHAALVQHSHFRDYHLMLDEQSHQIFSMTDVIAERAKKLGCATIRSIGQISRFQRIVDNNDGYVKPLDMIAELRDDNAKLTINMREVHSLCDEVGDVATASLLENWIDETEKRTWFLFECCRQA
jgi:starvation-inducible DNA-binding protein